MKKFLIRTSLFILMVTVAMCVLDVVLTKKLNHYEYRPMLGWNEIYDGSSVPRVACSFFASIA